MDLSGCPVADTVTPIRPPDRAPLPRAIDSERVVLNYCIEHAEECTDVLERVPPEQWSDSTCRTAMLAIGSLIAKGKIVDSVAIVQQVGDPMRLSPVWLSALLTDTPFVLDPTDQIERIQECYRLRQLIQAAQLADAAARSGTTSERIVQDLTTAIERAKGAERELVEWQDTDSIFAQLPPISWLCKHLQMAPGRPNLLAGHNYSGKSMFASTFAFAVASGQLLWGKHHVQQGRALHLNYDQGKRVPARRYQRLAAAQMLGPSDLQDNLWLASHPRIHLTDPKAYEWLLRQCDGAQLLIVDSLRAACPGIEENDSRMREPIDMLGAVSDQTGVCVLIVAHSRKAWSGPGAPRMTKAEVRGSGAIVDACENVFVLEPRKGCPTRVLHEKAGITGNTLDDFDLQVLDVEIDGNPRGGLMVLETGTSTLQQSDIDEVARLTIIERRDKLAAEVMGLFAREPVQTSADVISQKLGRKVSRVREVIAYLLDGPDAKLVSNGYGKTRKITVI